MKTSKSGIRRLMSSSTLRLTFTYLVIIMTMSIAYSTVLYAVSVGQLDHQRPKEILRDYTGPFRYPSYSVDIDEALDNRVYEAKQQLIEGLIALNLTTLIIGAMLSYILARLALRPIEESLEAQSQFVSDASHELRTPLTALQSTNEVALRKKKLSLAEAKEIIGYNIEESTKLQQLASALLGLMQDEKQVAKEAVSVQASVADAMTTVAPLAVAKDITLDDKTMRYFVYAQKQPVSQVLTILLDNAIKYSPESSTVTISSRQRGNMVTVFVRDEGIGMDKETQKRVFARFYRADQSRSRKTPGGYGLGLAIAKKIVESLDGKIGVESIDGKGSEFMITLPVAKI